MAEGAPLLRVYGLTPIEGSNPSLSANFEETWTGSALIEACEGFEPVRGFDKTDRISFDRAQRDPKGAGQDVRSNPSLSANFEET